MSALTLYLDNHPASAWRPALLLNIGKIYRSTGYISRALSAWEGVWQLTKASDDYEARAIANDAAGELAELYAKLGRYPALEALFTQVSGRNLGGAAGTRLAAMHEGDWVMENRPEVGFLCGPAALRNVGEALGKSSADLKLLDHAFSTTNGTSLAQLQHWADQMGLNMQMAKRGPGAELILPAVVHWKSGHFAALVRQEGDRFLMEGPDNVRAGDLDEPGGD